MDSLNPPFDITIRELLLANRTPEHPLLVFEDQEITIAELAGHATQWAGFLTVRGIRPGDAVATMLTNSPTHAALFLAIALVGALWVPINPEARGPSLVHMVDLTEPRLILATAKAADQLAAQGLAVGREVLVADDLDPQTLPQAERSAIHEARPDDIRAILFTSGTSGPPKGVQVSERMLIASAAGTAFASECREGDRYLMWEPLHHIGGSQVLLMAMAYRARLVMVERFSASRFWPQVHGHCINKLHYLGGILEILLSAVPRPDDRNHSIELAFGGGCRADVWRNFQTRFGIDIREVYGMTEASSFTTVNTSGLVGSVGRPVGWLNVEIADQNGDPVGNGKAGEITVTARHPGLFTPGYLKAPDATKRLLSGGRLHSGDLGRCDDDGNLFYVGRKTDSLRRRGENISAWEVETALAGHPDIVESAVVGVPASIGEHEILCFLVMREGSVFDPAALAIWCQTAMPPHHVPRYFKQVNLFERTPSQRIRKELLDRDLADAQDTAPPRDRNQIS